MIKSAKQFKNPYEEICTSLRDKASIMDADEAKSFLGREIARLNCEIPASEFAFIKNLRIGSGTLQTTGNTLWFKLVEECRRRGITAVTDQEAFEHFVANCILVLPDELKASTDNLQAAKQVIEAVKKRKVKA